MLPREQGRDFEGFFRTDGWDHGRIYSPTRALEPAYWPQMMWVFGWNLPRLRYSAITTGVVNKMNIAMFMWLGHFGWPGAGHDDTTSPPKKGALSSGILPRLPENSGEIFSSIYDHVFFSKPMWPHFVFEECWRWVRSNHISLSDIYHLVYDRNVRPIGSMCFSLNKVDD